MKKALKALEGDREEAQKILNTLVEERYVDDLRYAEAFARDKSSIAGWGVAKIRYMLSAKGVDRELISAALEEIDQSKADDRLVKLIENKKRSLKDDPQAQMKLVRFALGRGYTYDEISGVLKDYDEL
jgi:regulatory protein